MKLKTLSVWIKVILIGFAVCGVIILGAAVPSIGKSIVKAYPEFAAAYMPWMVFLWIAAVPCFVVLVLGWQIASNIASDNAFSSANAKLLRIIAILAAVDAAYFFFGNIVLWLLNMNHPGLVLMSLVVVFLGAAICVASSALSHLTSRAADIEDENRLTI